MTSSLDGRRIVLTGAGSGIGLATARLLAQHGARLALIARSRDGLEAAASAVTTAGYVAAKHAVRGFLGSLRVELRNRSSRVEVCMVHPGFIGTPFFDHATSARSTRPHPLRPVYRPQGPESCGSRPAAARPPAPCAGVAASGRPSDSPPQRRWTPSIPCPPSAAWCGSSADVSRDRSRRARRPAATVVRVMPYR
jgi:NAD(P)-dependent dehydrogenase (short-subunit alcohol dehydrogenase family)